MREALPDQSPYRAWANFEFISDDGKLYEVDCLVVTIKGLFLVELKHYQGTLEGSGVSRWHRSIGARRWEEDNPLQLANFKSKLLRSAMQRHVGRDVRLPFVHSLVFLSNEAQDVRLRGTAAVGMSGPQGATWTGKGKIPSIADALTSNKPDADGRTSREYSPQQLAAAIKAFEKLGIKESVGRRSVRHYVLTKTLDHGDVYQDFLGEHRRSPERKRRVRLYPNGLAASDTQREAALRVAEREFTLFAGLSHPGIDAPQEFDEHELGPALLFEYDPGATRLDQWLRTHAQELAVELRLRVIRDIAEAVGRAHEDRIFHRSLSSHSVYVSGEPAEFTVKIRNWHNGVRATLDDGQTRLPTATTSSIGDLISADGDIVERFRAPEVRNTANPNPRAADVFSLGALAYHVLSGADPAASAANLDEQLLAHDGLRLDGAVDGVPEDMQMLVWEATQKVPADRFASVAEFLQRLDDVEADARTEDVAASSFGELDPLEARKGDVLAERFTVKARLGKGATAIALLVSDDEANGDERVLKVALSPEHDTQLLDEAGALGRLQHPQIVRLIADPLELAGRTSLLMARAGKDTLAERLNRDGAVGLEFLQRWGVDLLGALSHLEGEGIAHRDLKPANIGVAEQGKNKELHLVVFDFSLTKVPDREIAVGTTGFIDPFLRVEGRNRWDSHAERFAAAVVLYQMATNELPTWGHGGADPVMVDDEVTLDPARFDAGIAGPLTEFFATALAREVSNRFGSADEMGDAWLRCFEERKQPVSETPNVELSYDSLTQESSVNELELSTKVASTLDRAGVYSIEDLLAIDPVSLNRMRGVGKVTVGEIRELLATLRPIFGSGVAPAPAPMLDGPPSVDRLLREVLAVAETDKAHAIVEAHLGLHAEALGQLPNQTRVANLAKSNQGTVSRTLIDTRAAWAQLPSLLALCDLVAELLASNGGVAALDQLGQRVLARCGSTASGPERRASGTAVVRAALDVEVDGGDPRWMLRRHGDALIVALDPEASTNNEMGLPPSSEAIAWAVALAKRAEALALSQNPLTSDRVVQELRAIRAPALVTPFGDRELVSLAASASDIAEVSPRGELYPQGMPADEALRRSIGSLLGVNELTPRQLQERVSARYPRASPLPDDAAATPLLAELGLGLAWDAAGGRWRMPSPSSAFSARTSHTASSTLLAAPDEGADFSSRLDLAHSSGRLLVMAARISGSRHQRALAALSNQDVTLIDIDAELIRTLRLKAAELEVDWQVILDADQSGAAPDDAGNLKRLVDLVVRELEERLVQIEGTILLHNMGLLARFDHLTVVERLRTAVQFGNNPLRSVWVLTAAEATHDAPMVDGHAIGIISPSEFAHVPKAWIDAQEAAV